MRYIRDRNLKRGGIRYQAEICLKGRARGNFSCYILNYDLNKIGTFNIKERMPSARTKVSEKLVLDLYLRNMRNEICSEEYPDPPDCIIKKKDGTSEWIEVRGVYPGEHVQKHGRLAVLLNSSNSNGELFSPPPCKFEDLTSVYENDLVPDVMHAIMEKEANKQYQKPMEMYGLGVLLLVPEATFYSSESMAGLTLILRERFENINLTRFRCVYLYEHSTHSLDKGILQSYPQDLHRIYVKNQK